MELERLRTHFPLPVLSALPGATCSPWPPVPTAWPRVTAPGEGPRKTGGPPLEDKPPHSLLCLTNLGWALRGTQGLQCPLSIAWQGVADLGPEEL